MIATSSVILRVSPAEFIEISGIEQFPDASGYTSQLAIGSGRFTCSEHPFYFDSLSEFARDITKAYEHVEGKARLGNSYEEDFIEIEVLSGGHVSVTGRIVQHGPPRQELQFEFRCDQTFLPELLRSLSQATKELGGKL